MVAHLEENIGDEDMASTLGDTIPIWYEEDGTRTTFHPVEVAEGEPPKVEQIVLPSMEFGIEWVLDHPIPYHTFDEPPVIVESEHPIGFDEKPYPEKFFDPLH